MIIHDADHAWCVNASSQLVSSIKDILVEGLKIMRVSMVNPFWINSIEAQSFPSAKPPTPFYSTRPAVSNHSLCQTQAKGPFDLLTHDETKQL